MPYGRRSGLLLCGQSRPGSRVRGHRPSSDDDVRSSRPFLPPQPAIPAASPRLLYAQGGRRRGPDNPTTIEGIPVIGGLHSVADVVQRVEPDTVAGLGGNEMNGGRLRNLAWALGKTGALGVPLPGPA